MLEREARVHGLRADLERASQLVISMRRLWPALAAAPLRSVCTSRVPSAGPSRYVPGGIATCRL